MEESIASHVFIYDNADTFLFSILLDFILYISHGCNSHDSFAMKLKDENARNESKYENFFAA